MAKDVQYNNISTSNINGKVVIVITLTPQWRNVIASYLQSSGTGHVATCIGMLVYYKDKELIAKLYRSHHIQQQIISIWFLKSMPVTHVLNHNCDIHVGEGGNFMLQYVCAFKSIMWVPQAHVMYLAVNKHIWFSQDSPGTHITPQLSTKEARINLNRGAKQTDFFRCADQGYIK